MISTLFILPPAIASQSISTNHNSYAESQLNPAGSKKKAKRRGWFKKWRERPAHPNSKATNNIAYLSFLFGLVTFAVFVTPGLVFSALAMAPASGVLGLLAWHRRPSKRLARAASILGGIIGLGLVGFTIFLIIALIDFIIKN